MHLLRRLSLRFRLNLALGCLAAIGLGATGLHAWRANASQQAAEAAFDANATADLLLQAAGAWAVERGMVNTALHAPMPAAAETLAAIGSRRAAANGAAAAAITTIDLPAAAMTALATSRQALTALQAQADTALTQALPERPAGLGPRWFAGITAVIEASQRLRHDAAFHEASPAARLAALQQLKQAVWVVSEYAGRERAVLGGVIAAKAAISPAQLLELGGYRGRVDLAWAEIQAFAASADVPAAVRDAIGTVDDAFFGQFQAVRMQVYAAGMGNAGYPIEGQAWVGRATQAIDTVLALSRATGDAAALLAAGSAGSERGMVWGTVAAFGIELLIVVASLLVVTMQVVRPLARLSLATRQLAAGKLRTAIPCQGWTDELGDLAASVIVLRDGMVEKLRLEQEGAAAGIRRAAEDERSRRDAEQAAAAAEFVVGSVGGALARLAAGDLSFRLAAVLPGNYDTLRADLNAATDRLQDAMQSIVGSVQAVRSGTGKIAQASDDLSRRTENQAASLEQTAAALDQVTATVRKTADGAKQARAIVADTQKEAAHSGEVVRQAVLAMGKIERSSSEIGEIIGVIDEIAFQTSLLALNASVEAARAGDAGRGFAVVASEVRALALRSAGAAKEIKALVHASSQQVGAGVKLVGESGQALVRIVAQVDEITTVVADIAASAQEQATALHEVNTAVNQMDQVTQQNAAMVEQTTAATHSLAQEMEGLARLTGSFTLIAGPPGMQELRASLA